MDWSRTWNRLRALGGRQIWRDKARWSAGTGEFEVQRRGEEVPAVTQIYHMERSLAELQEDFGKQALELKPGNNSWSKSQFNNTAELAARVGFGLFHGQVWRTSFPTLIPPTTSSTFLIHNNPQRWPDHLDRPRIS